MGKSLRDTISAFIKTVPGGSSVDPQWVCDELRSILDRHPAADDVRDADTWVVEWRDDFGDRCANVCKDRKTMTALVKRLAKLRPPVIAAVTPFESALPTLSEAIDAARKEG